MVEQVELTQHAPRASFNDTPPTESDPQPQLIVASPTEQSVQPQPKPILEPPKFIDESIVARVRARRLQPPPTNSVPNESIADRVARWRREAAHWVLNQKTGQLLKYCQLLKIHDSKRYGIDQPQMNLEG